MTTLIRNNTLWDKIKVNYWHFIDFTLQGKKPTRIRVNKLQDNGYFIDLTSGGYCNEGFIRISKGKKNWYYPNYARKANIRVNNYTLDINNNRI